MLKPESMSNIRITASLSHVREVISELYNLKLLHITDHKKSRELDIGEPMKQSAFVSELLLKYRALIALLELDTSAGVAKPQRLTIREIAILLKEIERRAAPLRHDLSGRLMDIEKRKALIESLSAAGVRLDYLDIKSLGFSLVVLKQRVGRHAFRDITDRVEVFSAPFEKKFLHAVFFDRSKENVLDRLKSMHAEIVDTGFLAAFSGFGSFDEAASQLSSQIAKLRKSIAAQERIKLMLIRKYQDVLIHAELLLSQEAEKSEAPLRFAVTKHAFVAGGWVPSAKLPFLQERLESRLKRRVSIEIVKTKESPPTKFRHPQHVRPFQFFLNLYSIPKYGEIDPSHLMALTFPLFFGFMLGDIGYGLTTLAIFLVLRARIKSGEGRKLLNALILSSLAAIFFGFVFGEFFGEEHVLGFQLPHLLSRAEQITELMMVAIIIGIVHINIGLLIGFFNVLEEHGFLAAVFEKLSWVSLQVGALALFKSSGNAVLLIVGIALILAAVAMLVASEGWLSIIELPTIFTNILSYARLMALGLASVSLAVLINRLAFQLFHSGGVGIIGGVAVLLIGQGINILLGIIGPFLHSLRLHYVEFFGKFYKGGGKPYVPFGEHTE